MKTKQTESSDVKVGKIVKQKHSGNVEKKKKKRKKQWEASIPQLTADQIDTQPKDETLTSVLQQKFKIHEKSAKQQERKKVNPFAPSTTDFKLHDIKFIEPSVKTINNLAYDKWSNLLALSREDGSIEILDLRNDFQTKQIIPASTDRTTECMLWCKGELYTASLHGEIIKWDLQSLSPATRYSSNGGAVWCMSVSNSEQYLAAGCEDGSVRVYQTYNMLAWEAQGLQYVRSMEPQEGRVLSIAWNNNDTKIVTGGIDSTIRIYSFETGKSKSRITTNNLKERNTLIWTLQYLKDGTIVTGDSLGNVQFWDGRLYTLKQSLSTHRADVLTLCVNHDETVIYATGIDYRIVRLSKIKEKLSSEQPSSSKSSEPSSSQPSTTTETRIHWVNQGFKTGAKHDNRAIAYIPDLSDTRGKGGKKKAGDHNILISTGVDPRLFIFPELGKNFKQIYFPGNNKALTFSKGASLLSHQSSNKIDLWQMNDSTIPGGMPTLAVTMMTKTEEGVLAHAVSNDGKFLAYSTVSVCRLFLLRREGAEWGIKKAKFLMGPCSQLQFTQTSDCLVLLSLNGNIQSVDLSGIGKNDKEGVNTTFMDIVQEFNIPQELKLKPHWRHLCISPDDKMVAVYGDEDVGAVFSMDTREVVAHLPKVEGTVTSIAFKPASPLLFILTNFVSNISKLNTTVRLYDFDVQTENFGLVGEQLTALKLCTGRLHFNKENTKPGHAVRKIFFSESHPQHLFFHNGDVLGKVLVDKPLLPAERWAKEKDTLSKHVRVNKHFRHARSVIEYIDIMFADFDSKGELVIVSPNGELGGVIVDKLPSSLKTKKFGY